MKQQNHTYTCVSCSQEFGAFFPCPPHRHKLCHSCDCNRRRRRRQAHLAVRKARLRGELPPPTSCTCVDCGAPAKVYEHRDYDKPLEVQPTCYRCNSIRGMAAA
jgi:hypothetical protein